MTTDTKKLRELAEKAAPGPWSVRYDYVVQTSSSEGGRIALVAQPYGVNADGSDLFANARLIAEGINALPALLSTLESEAAEIAEAKGQIEHLDRENNRLREATRWQPIETAPHDTTVLLGWTDWDGAWVAEVSMATWGWRTERVSNISSHGRATHWMPLPAAPGALNPTEGS